MAVFLDSLWQMLARTAPWWGVALAAFALCYVFTPLCRALARACGMVDQPSARRINTRPTPRAGGLAVYLATMLAVLGYMAVTGAPASAFWSYGPRYWPPYPIRRILESYCQYPMQ